MELNYYEKFKKNLSLQPRKKVEFAFRITSVLKNTCFYKKICISYKIEAGDTPSHNQVDT